MPGTLYIVATPIGNLEDITLRAVRVLKEAAVVACEDTRHTRNLLEHLGIRKPLISYHEHNEATRAAELVAKLESGLDVALVSYAGTPLVSDPGFRIVDAAVARGIPVCPIPGPSAAIAALAASGLPADAFRFGGFLPSKAGPRRKLLEELREDQATLIFFEAPHRIVATLGDIEAVLGERTVVLARELTKVHEEFLRGTPAILRGVLTARPAVKGEITVLIAKTQSRTSPESSIEDDVAQQVAAGLSRMEAIKSVARRRGLSKREVYRLVQRGACRSSAGTGDE